MARLQLEPRFFSIIINLVAVVAKILMTAAGAGLCDVTRLAAGITNTSARHFETHVECGTDATCINLHCTVIHSALIKMESHSLREDFRSDLEFPQFH